MNFIFHKAVRNYLINNIRYNNKGIIFNMTEIRIVTDNHHERPKARHFTAPQSVILASLPIDEFHSEQRNMSENNIDIEDIGDILFQGGLEGEHEFIRKLY